MVVPGRRKEVGLGNLKTFAIFSTLCCGAVVPSIGAGLDDSKTPVAPASTPSPPPEATPRPEPPVAPRKYLDTGAHLFNKGRYELAAKYLEAAQLYRDRLTSNERIVLDLYREKFDVYSKPPKPEEFIPETVAVRPALSGPRDANVEAASIVGRSVDILAPLTSQPSTGIDPANSPSKTFTGEVPESSAAMPASTLSGSIAGRDTTDIKQKARWLLQLARDQMFRKEFDAAERTITEARTYKVKWGFFDETPDKLSAALTKARAKGIAGKPSSGVAGSTEPTTGLDAVLTHDRRTARNALRDARIALNAGQTDRADAIVRDLRTWDVRYGMFEDTPDKLSVAISDARRREASRSADLMVRSYLGNSSRPVAPINNDIPPQVQSPAPEAPRPE